MNQDPQFSADSSSSPQPSSDSSPQPAANDQASDFLRGQRIAEKAQLEQQFTSGSSWFFWIAGLSLVNSLISFFGGSLHFVFGLGITQLVDAIVMVREMGTAGHVFALVFDLAIAGLFFIFGYLSSRRMRWAFVLGMVLYTLDTLLLLLLINDYISAAVHAYVLYRMFAAVTAIKKLRDLETVT